MKEKTWGLIIKVTLTKPEELFFVCFHDNIWLPVSSFDLLLSLPSLYPFRFCGKINLLPLILLLNLLVYNIWKKLKLLIECAHRNVHFQVFSAHFIPPFPECTDLPVLSSIGCSCNKTTRQVGQDLKMSVHQFHLLNNPVCALLSFYHTNSNVSLVVKW